MKKTCSALALAGLLLMLGACAGTGSGPGGSSAGGSTGSGITVFGTMDAAVTGTRNR